MRSTLIYLPLVYALLSNIKAQLAYKFIFGRIIEYRSLQRCTPYTQLMYCYHDRRRQHLFA